MSNKPLKKYKFLSNQTLALPTELLQVGFFRNNAEQNRTVIKHNLSKQRYKLVDLNCDTFVETPLFSMLLVDYHNYYLKPENVDNDEGIILNLNIQPQTHPFSTPIVRIDGVERRHHLALKKEHFKAVNHASQWTL
ncbi:hypothetical protein AB6D11_20895 [Vibrio splendidus]